MGMTGAGGSIFAFAAQAAGRSPPSNSDRGRLWTCKPSMRDQPEQHSSALLQPLDTKQSSKGSLGMLIFPPCSMRECFICRQFSPGEEAFPILKWTGDWAFPYIIKTTPAETLFLVFAKTWSCEFWMFCCPCFPWTCTFAHIPRKCIPSPLAGNAAHLTRGLLVWFLP